MNKLLIAAAVVIGLSVAVAMTKRSHEAKTTLEKPSATLPVVKKDEVTTLEIAKPGKPAVVLQKQGDKKWRVSAPVDAEASQSAVDSALDKLSDLTVTGVAATHKENYAKLEVDPEHAIHVKAKAGDKQVADLYIGASKTGGTMVRVEGQEPVLAVRGSIRYPFDKEVKDFRKREITDVPAAELTGIDISSDKGSFKFEKQGDAWAQAKGEKPIANFDPQKVQSLSYTLGSLRANDFAAKDEPDSETGLDAPRAKITLTKKDGGKVEIELGKEHASGDSYVRATGGEVVYRVAKYTADRLRPDAKAFEKTEAKANEPHAGMVPIAGGGDLPPDVMKQLQQLKGHPGSPH